MNTTTTYRDLLAYAASELDTDADPDGLAARQALLLAAHAGIRRADGAASADWDLYTVAITQAVQELQADLDDPVILATGLPGPGPDCVDLRRQVSGLVRRLADRYAHAAEHGGHAAHGPDTEPGPVGGSEAEDVAGRGGGSPWRRLVWARVASLLDDAIAELR